MSRYRHIVSPIPLLAGATGDRFACDKSVIEGVATEVRALSRGWDEWPYDVTTWERILKSEFVIGITN